MEKTETLPGIPTVKIKELSDALEELRLARKSRMDSLKTEVEEQDKVLALMHKHKIEAYKDDDFDPPLEGWIVKGDEKIRVKLVKEKKSDDPD